MPKYDTVLFDFDGTMVDSTKAIISAWQHTYKTLTGREGSESEILATFGEKLDTSLAKKFPDTPVEDSVRIYVDYQRAILRDAVKMFPGVRDVLNLIKENDIRLGLVTSRHRETFEIIYDSLKLDGYFGSIVTCEDTEKHKPDPEPVSKALTELESKPERSLMIGDSIYDMLSAHNAGVDFALVSWTDTVELQKEHDGKLSMLHSNATDDIPEHIVENANDITGLIL